MTPAPTRGAPMPPRPEVPVCTALDGPLELDTDPAAYLAAHALADEPAADSALTARELTIRTAVRDLVAREVVPRAAQADRAHEFAGDGLYALLRAGWGGLLFSAECGGTGDTHVGYAVALEEITAGCAATSLIFMTQTHAAYPIALAGSAELAQRYVPGLLSGQFLGALGVTEPDAGSDVAGLRTTATRTAAGYRLTGSKTFITNGDRADVLVCFATVDRRAGRAGVTPFVVDCSLPGVTRGTPFRKLGMRGSTTSQVFFDDVQVPASHRLGEEGAGWQIALRSVTKSRISAAAQGVGLARNVYLRALTVLRRRHGTRLPAEALFVLAGLRGEILQGRLLLHAVARQADLRPAVSAAEIAIMKQACTDLGWRATVAAVRLLGPDGDRAVFGVERGLRDAKVTQIYDGTNEIQRLLIGRDLTRAMEAMA